MKQKTFWDTCSHKFGFSVEMGPLSPTPTRKFMFMLNVILLYILLSLFFQRMYAKGCVHENGTPNITATQSAPETVYQLMFSLYKENPSGG
ncbi:hypothetical protein BDZ91DRAFT_803857 [Kalaharituber pfeilii]|nr:hypothetical protein BDZ91DRAFT_803857 [Kalaharituber pfeilii]